MQKEPRCEHCADQIHCRNLYVALKILEEEIRFVDRHDIWQEYERLKSDVAASGYNYPSGSPFCTLSINSGDALNLVERADTLLRELRHTISISPA
jgi:hypothetical protein